MKEIEKFPSTVGQIGNDLMWDHMSINKKIKVNDQIIVDVKKDFHFSRKLQMKENKKQQSSAPNAWTRKMKRDV